MKSLAPERKDNNNNKNQETTIEQLATARPVDNKDNTKLRQRKISNKRGVAQVV